MTDNTGEYHRGEMDISEQESTFALVMVLGKWAGLGAALIIVFFTLWLYPRGNFWLAAITSFVLLVVGIWGLRKKRSDT